MQLASLTGDKSAQTVDVNEGLLDVPFNESLIHEVVTAYLASVRQGTKAQKTRSEVSGGGIKPWRQKGTGRARAGSIRSPLWRKGGVIFAAKPRDYTKKVNKKAYRKAFCSILSELRRQERLIVIESMPAVEPKTKEMVKLLASLGLERDVLIIVSELSEALYLAARNLPKVNVCDVLDIDPVSLVAHDKVVVTAEALKIFEEQFS